MPLKIAEENKKVFTTPHATVVIVNGEIRTMKVCRPAHEVRRGNGTDYIAERTLVFDSYTEFTKFVEECLEVFHAVDKELNQ